ncbi:MAG: DUF3467 domain-containing protein [Methanoregula sp.]|nr:DUF3467 domain-containing protein [Methanoregula sp.]
MDEVEKIEATSISIDVGALYDFKVKDLELNLTDEYYSNTAFVQITQRDVRIDFLRMPGIKKDGKMVVNGVRVFMTHAAAQKMSLAIGATLKKVHSDGELENYNPDAEKTYTPSNTIKRKQHDTKI